MTLALPTGTVTFLLTDVEGSTVLLREIGAERYSAALIEHRRLLRDAIAAHGGIEVDTQGDAFFFAFADARAALAGAEAGQAALAGGLIRVRMGLHTGEALLAGGGYVGVDVHKGARVAAAGHGGQIVVSEAARLAAGRELRPLGTHRLKDLTAPEPLWQLGDGDFPALTSLNRTNLPVQPSPLIGRLRELEEARGLLAEARVLTLVGSGGSGKTRLALQLAAELVEDYPHGVWWVPLQALRDPRLVVPSAASTVGAQGDLTDHVAGKRMLLLLDNMEQLVDAAPELAAMSAAAEGLKLLVTSREPLRIAGEVEYHVEPLEAEEALALFRERAAESEPLDAVREICRRLDYLPLAIELAAARTKLLPPDRLLARLEQRLPLLTGSTRDAPDRQRTLRATIEWSYDLLTAEEQAVFVRLGVFAGSFDVDAAGEVCAADLDVLQSLLEKNLLRRWGSGRLGMLETVREYAEEHLARLAPVELGDLRRLHGAYFVALAEQAGPELRGPEQRAWRERLELEHDNVRAVLAWAREAGDAETGLRLGGALWRFWRTSNRLEEGAGALEAFLARGDGPPEMRGRALLGASRLAMDRGDVGQAVEQAQEALAAAERGGTALDRAAAAENLGLMLLVRALDAGGTAMEQALALLEESVERFRALGDHVGAADALNNLGNGRLDAGDRAGAWDALEEAVALQREAGNALGLAFALNTLGFIALHDGRLDVAGGCFAESVELFHDLGDVSRTGDTLEGLAELAVRRRDARCAATLWGAGAGAALRAEAGKSMEPSERALRDQSLAQVREHLGDEALAEAWAEGEALEPEQAVAVGLASVRSLD